MKSTASERCHQPIAQYIQSELGRDGAWVGDINFGLVLGPISIREENQEQSPLDAIGTSGAEQAKHKPSMLPSAQGRGALQDANASAQDLRPKGFAEHGQIGPHVQAQRVAHHA